MYTFSLTKSMYSFCSNFNLLFSLYWFIHSSLLLFKFLFIHISFYLFASFLWTVSSWSQETSTLNESSVVTTAIILFSFALLHSFFCWFFKLVYFNLSLRPSFKHKIASCIFLEKVGSNTQEECYGSARNVSSLGGCFFGFFF